jgi:hypothetical protein
VEKAMVPDVATAAKMNAALMGCIGGNTEEGESKTQVVVRH